MPTSSPSRSLRIKSFRGAPKDLTFVFDHRRPLTLIYGENGSGKTTICDAYDFIANKRVGSLADRGLGQLHPYWATSGKSGTDIVVELTIDGNTWTGRAKARDINVAPADPPPPKVELLRRATLARFVTGDPKDRYAALRPFIDMACIEQAEQALREQVRSSENRLNQAASNIGENQETLRRMMVEAAAVGTDPVAWARAILAVPAADSSAATADLRKLERLVDAAATAVDELVAADGAAKTAQSHVHTAQQELDTAERSALAIEVSLVSLLEAAQQHMSKHAVIEACPLCESPDRAQDLKERVAERIAAASQVRALAGAVKSATPVAEVKAVARASALQKAKLAVEAVSVAAAPDDWRTAHDLAVQAASASLSAEGDFIAPDLTALRAAGTDAAGRRAALEASAAKYSGVKTALDQHDENVSKQAGLSLVLPRLKQALEVCEKQRKQYLEQVLVAIAVEVGRLYEVIHPGEGLNKISFKLSPTRQGSLDLGAEFLGKQDQPPQAYFSESHLDSLGLCIFLALAARQAPESTIVVLDDVLGSIDEPHVDRLIGMLYDEARKFKHTILTTHYRPWREKFRWGWLQNNQCEFIELGAWTPEDGIVSAQNSLSPLAQLRSHLAASPPLLQPACAAAGVILERACDFLAELYELDMPYRSRGLTLGELLPRVAEKRMVAALRVEVRQPDGSYADVSLGDQLIRLRDMAQLRNIFGCHYNELANMLPPQDALAFAQAVHDFATALICDENGWPRSDKSGSFWATQGETRRLHPLKKPR
jgi:AAA domain